MSDTAGAGRPLLLMVDDDLPLRRLIEVALGKSWSIKMAENGEAAMAAFDERTPDLVILDVNMPKMDGWQTLVQIRAESDVPVIMLTAQDRMADVEKGFKLGADDYMTKPFAFQELKTRIEAILERSRQRGFSKTASPRHPSLRLDEETGQAWIGRRAIEVSPLEYRVLDRLMKDRPHVVTKEALFHGVWGISSESYGHLVDKVIDGLRQKIEADPENPEIIMTSREGGYYLNDPG